MTDFLNDLHKIENFENAILSEVCLNKSKNEVTVKIITDKPYTKTNKDDIFAVSQKFVPEFFKLSVEVVKLTPDCEMVRQKIKSAIEETYKSVSVTLRDEDINVEKTEGGFDFSVSVMPSILKYGDMAVKIAAYLKKCYCGDFTGRILLANRNVDELDIEEEKENINFEVPIRTFEIYKFSLLEGTEKHKTAVYLADSNFETEKVILCGNIENIEERTFKTGKKQGQTYYSFTISDKTATLRITYFPRQRSIEKIKALKIGDGIVCTCKAELFNGYMRHTAEFIDYGNLPENFVPEKRVSKPVPKYYSVIRPEPFTDIKQTDMFTKSEIPSCLKGKSFVVFDLETTGLNSAPTSGNMDRIIEIGAFKIIDGIICESFTTFINPQKKLSEEIIKLTGITEDMVANAPTYENAMPDFFKFCSGSYLVGHNIAGFDYKFVDYYCAKLGYMLERKIIDTIPLSQELLFLSNYKLNTVADKFGIVFNHHRAIDDALVTAKIFIELIKIKKSLPKLQ